MSRVTSGQMVKISLLKKFPAVTVQMVKRKRETKKN